MRQGRTAVDDARENGDVSARFLASVGEELGKSLDYATTLLSVAHLAVPFLADICVVELVADAGRLKPVAVAHSDAAQEGWLRELAVVATTDVLELMTRLVDKSLVVANVDQVDGRSRYRLLEPIRQYARQRLVGSGELETVRARHGTFFLAFAEALERDASVGGARRQSAADCARG